MNDKVVKKDLCLDCSEPLPCTDSGNTVSGMVPGVAVYSCEGLSKVSNPTPAVSRLPACLSSVRFAP